MEEKEKNYEDKIKKLVGKIKDIEKKSLYDWEKSDEILSLLREECLFLHEDYIDGYANFSEKATLDFNHAFLKFDLSNVEVLPTKFYPIFANSFGPFNPKAFFDPDPDNIKILWLLKESYISKDSWIKKGDRGGHDQAKEYNKWENIKGTNDTKERVVKITKKILSIIDKKSTIDKVDWEADSDETYQKVMDHICILEVQHFPGLNFLGVETDDQTKYGKFRVWAELNKPLYETLIKFYSPTIIIGGYTLPYLFPYIDEKDNLWMLCRKKHGKDRFVQIEEKVKNSADDLKLLNKNIIAYFHNDNKKYPEEIEYPGDNRHQAYLDDKGIIYVDAYHPAPKYGIGKDYEYTDEKAKIDAVRINLLTKYYEENKKKIK